MSFAALGILMSCSGEDMPGNITGGDPGDIMTQEIKFYISGGNQPGDIRTRVAPPGSEGGLDNTIIPCSCQVDRIRLLTFRRVEGSDDSFVYDAKNSTSGSNDIKADKGEFTAEDGTLIKEGRVSEAHTITKEKGYEYRVIAIGYNTQRKAMNHESTHGNNENSFPKSTINESSLFKIVDKVELQANAKNLIPARNELKDGISKFEDVSLQLVPLSFENEAGYITTDQTIKPAGWNSTKKNLTGWYQITPEIFYGSCRSKGSDSEIIKFSDENEITGYLYRGVAKLTATVKNISDLPSPGDRVTNHVCAIALLADSVRQAVRLSDYENFRTPYFHHDNLPAHNLAGFGGNCKDTPRHTFTAIDIDGWVDPKGIECHDYREGDGEGEGEENSYTFETFLLPTQTRLYLRYARGWEGEYIHHTTETNCGDYLLVVNNKSDGNQATGIIDPVAGGEFVYFRRNYQYTLNVDCSIIANDNNWEELRVK